MAQHGECVGITFPKISKGRPMNASMLLWSEVFNDVGFERVVARVACGGDPESSRFCSRPKEVCRECKPGITES